MKSAVRFCVSLVFGAHLCSSALSPSGQSQSAVTPAGTISTVAGDGVAGFGGDGESAVLASLNRPLAVTVVAGGSLFIADFQNNRIRRVTPDGIISTVAGGGTTTSGDGGPATSEALNGAAGVALDAAGSLFVSENWSNRVRKVSPGGVISTVAGTGVSGFTGDAGPATSARIDFPTDLAVDAAGNLFIADSDNRRVRKVTPEGIITTIAGGGVAGLGDGGPAIEAKLGYPVAVAVDAAGNLFIADSVDSRVRRVTADGMISTFAGNGNSGFSGDGGPAASATLNAPGGLAVDSAGNVFIADTGNNRIRKVSPAGAISTIAGTGTPGFSGDGGAASSAQFNRPAGLAVDTEGSLFVADIENARVRKISQAAFATILFPQVAVGGGYSTLFTIMNTGSTSASASLSMTSAQGTPLEVSATLTDAFGKTESLSAHAFGLTVPSGGIVLLSAAGVRITDSTTNAWAQLDSTGGSLTSVATYERVTDESVQTVVGVLQSRLLQYATIPVNNDPAQERQTAYAIANPGSRAVSVKLALVGQDGTVVDDSVTVTLGPHQQAAKYVWQDLNRTSFKGTLVFRAQGGSTFAVVALMDRRGSLTVIPLVPGKAPGVPD